LKEDAFRAVARNVHEQIMTNAMPMVKFSPYRCSVSSSFFTLTLQKRNYRNKKKMTEASASVASDWLWPSQSLSD